MTASLASQDIIFKIYICLWELQFTVLSHCFPFPWSLSATTASMISRFHLQRCWVSWSVTLPAVTTGLEGSTVPGFRTCVVFLSKTSSLNFYPDFIHHIVGSPENQRQQEIYYNCARDVTQKQILSFILYKSCMIMCFHK